MAENKYSPVPGSHKTPYICKAPPKFPSDAMLKWIESIAAQELFQPAWAHLYVFRKNWNGPPPALTFETDGPNFIQGTRTPENGTHQYRLSNWGRVGPATIAATATWSDGKSLRAVLPYHATFPT
jgi:hypothetical protein